MNAERWQNIYSYIGYSNHDCHV